MVSPFIGTKFADHLTGVLRTEGTAFDGVLLAAADKLTIRHITLSAAGARAFFVFTDEVLGIRLAVLPLSHKHTGTGTAIEAATSKIFLHLFLAGIT